MVLLPLQRADEPDLEAAAVGGLAVAAAGIVEMKKPSEPTHKGSVRLMWAVREDADSTVISRE